MIYILINFRTKRKQHQAGPKHVHQPSQFIIQIPILKVCQKPSGSFSKLPRKQTLFGVAFTSHNSCCHTTGRMPRISLVLTTKIGDRKINLRCFPIRISSFLHTQADNLVFSSLGTNNRTRTYNKQSKNRKPRLEWTSQVIRQQYHHM